MKSVLISIQPEYVFEIVCGFKTSEVRKTFPKNIELPFRVYIYCTKGNINYPFASEDADMVSYILNGSVIGYFDCINYCCISDLYSLNPNLMNKSNLTFNKLKDYSKGKLLYFWNFEKCNEYFPRKSLEDFGLKRAPQDWCYVEVDESISGELL